MLPDGLHKKLFPSWSMAGPPPNQKEILGVAKEHLGAHKIPFETRRAALPDLPATGFVPGLVGASLREHFYKLGCFSGQPYIALADEAVNFDFTAHFDQTPGDWSTIPGWTHYRATADREFEQKAVEFPDDEFLVFDTESCWVLGRFPVFAVALGPRGWYSWTAPGLDKATDDADLFSPRHGQRLIPMGRPAGPQLVIGHNVSFDRIAIADEYSLELCGRRFLDTMSMHCARAGLSSQQRALWKALNGETNDAARMNTDAPLQPATDDEGKGNEWALHSSMNSLVEAVRLHCGEILDKADLALLVDNDLEGLQRERQRILAYCARDVRATARLFKALWGPFKSETCPSPVSLAGMFMMGSFVLPVDTKWTRYIASVEAAYQSALVESERILGGLAEEICAQGMQMSEEDRRKDPWLSQLDWTLVPARYTKKACKPIGNEAMFGKPAWFAALYCRKAGGPKVTHRTREAPYLLRIRWNGHPVRHLNPQKWCYRVPEAERSALPKPVLSADGFDYYKVPHMTDEGANVGSLFSKHYIKAFEQGVLSADTPHLRELMSGHTRWSFWTGYRERLAHQLAVFGGEPGVDIEDPSTGIIIPGTVVMGTVTRRAVENTWMTAGNPKRSVAGSEQKAMVRAPPGFSIVGADVDSQELWIASLLGDSQFGEHGATAMGWMTLQGSRNDGTDLHSRTAAILGMRRDDAKIFTYGRIYGAGARYAASLLSRFNPKWTPEEARRKADELYAATKGQRVRMGATTDSFVRYSGGSESFMFNQLEGIATAAVAHTPILGCAISQALSGENVKDQVSTGSSFTTALTPIRCSI